MKKLPYVYAGAISAAVAVALGLSTATTTQADPPGKSKSKGIPVFAVDTSFPQPLPVAGQFGTPPAISSATGQPKPWVTGEVAGTCVDSQDHVFTVNRGNLINPETVTAVGSPTVIEFDQKGNVVNAFNVTGTQSQIHGCFVDYQDNIWIAGNGDGIVEKWSHDGKQKLLQIGTKGVCDNPPANTCGNSGANPNANQSHTLLNEPAIVWVDPGPDPFNNNQRGSVYIADGYGNHRVVVFSATGQYLRQWGGVAGTVNNPLTDFTDKFASGDGGHPHCVVGGNDGFIYTCDRADDRIQVWSKNGVLQRVIAVVPGTGVTLGLGGVPGLGTAGSAWDFRFTNDDNQTYMIEVDGGNEIVHTIDRSLGAIVADMGQPGHQAGQFTFLHSNTIDSQGNMYTGETINGRRIQKFNFVGCLDDKGKIKAKGDKDGSCSK